MSSDARFTAKGKSVQAGIITAAASAHGSPGGGVKAGVSYGATDDYSYNIVENPVHIRDLNATILHCLGMDHNRFTFRFQGLNHKPTGVEPAHVMKGILV